jgi:hypothetical protein
MIRGSVSEFESRARPYHQPGTARSRAANALNLLPLSACRTCCWLDPVANDHVRHYLPSTTLLSIRVSLPIEVLIWSAKMLAPGCALGTIQAV